VDGPQIQVVGFDAAKVTLDVGQVLVALHHGGGVRVSASTLARST
jgi:hypothetical protein